MVCTTPFCVYVTIAFGVPLIVSLMLLPAQIAFIVDEIEAIGNGTTVKDAGMLRIRVQAGFEVVDTLTSTKLAAWVNTPGMFTLPLGPIVVV